MRGKSRGDGRPGEWRTHHPRAGSLFAVLARGRVPSSPSGGSSLRTRLDAPSSGSLRSMRGTGTGRHGNGARHAQRTNDPPRSCVSACSRSPAAVPLLCVSQRGLCTRRAAVCVSARASPRVGGRGSRRARTLATRRIFVPWQGSTFEFLAIHWRVGTVGSS